MPPPLIIDPALLDPDQLLYSREEIYQALPQQFEFKQLDGICYYDPDKQIAAAVRDIREDEWWVRGHVPGRPIFPGVLMLEAVAQLSAYSCKYIHGFRGMVAYGGVDNCKFRAAVIPPVRLILVCQEVENRSRKIVCNTQAFLESRLVFEATVTGLAMPG
ncbi:MAG: beta-hydroxyacyl-ACP dehydratase [Phycisphaerae bacterium]|nr:beta-hydroxyacyl-ACP dehydratase [Phycisphaerae bacterium]